jgi:hypothetical protein
MAADEQLRRKLLPEEWKWVLVRGKDAFGQGTSKDPLDTEKTLGKIDSRRHRQTGLGVVTGDASNGLVAVDIDGPVAEELFKEALGEEWPDTKKPGTMSWRGRPGRRQLLYKLEDGVRSLLTKFTKEQFIEELKGTDEEVCIRYNGCYSVIPGSKHPDTKKPYEWIDYNDGVVAPAPGWLVDFMMKSAKPAEVHSFIPKEYLERQDASTDFTYRQMRRHFWMEGGLLEKLLAMQDGFDRVFNSEVWEYQPLTVENQEKGTMVGGCPFHDSNSGKSFTVWPNLNWYCHKEETGGDALMLLHALRERDINAGDPSPVVLQGYLQEIAEIVGLRYPEDFEQVQKIKKETKYETERPLLEHIREIEEAYENPAEAEIELMILADNYGIRKSPADLLFLLAKDEAFRSGGGLRKVKELCESAEDAEFIIPELLQKPQTVIVHGESNAGKTATVIALAKHILHGQPFKVRDEMMPVDHGPVIWFNGDCSATELKQAFSDADLTDAKDFYEVSDFKLSHKKRFQQYLNKVKPKLVVIDSLSSCLDDGVDENRREAAIPLYYLNNKNGTLWPSCSIIIIHHDNREGGYRGHSAIKGAVSEMWQIQEIPEDRREHLPNYRNQRIITNRKTRSGLKNRVMLSTLNEDFTVRVEDWHPEVLLDEGARPSVMDNVLRVLRRAEGPLRREEVESLTVRPKGDAAVRKSLQRLKAKGLIDSEPTGTRLGNLVYWAVTASRGDRELFLSQVGLNPVVAGEDDLGQPGTNLGQSTEMTENVPDASETSRCTHPTWDNSSEENGLSQVKSQSGTQKPLPGTTGGGYRETDPSGPPVRQPLSLDELLYPMEHLYPEQGPDQGDPRA